MLTIRQARPSDCDAMCELHRAAITHLYRSSHTDETVRGWADSVRADLCRRWLDSDMTIVAEEADSLLGYARFDPQAGSIEICIRPEAEKRAIASALLAVIETEARARGLERLDLLAMLNSERLFVASGFVGVGAGEISLASGVTLPSILMEKLLQYTEPRPDRRRSLMKVAGEG